jgi:predicted Rossmann fold nucleotide-binding protein DprA/Smf involved in DNA uptake
MSLTNDVQAALLLTCPLPGTSGTDARPLTTGEWNRLLVWLRDRGMKSGDLLLGDSFERLRGWNDPRCGYERIRRLLGRGMALGLALEKWQRAGIWIVARSEPEYPRRLRERLKSQSPPIIFGCGGAAMLEAGAVAIIGSRNASPDDEAFASSLGEKVAQCGRSVVSGGAGGIDQAVMSGVIEAGGTVIGVLADSLLRASVSQRYRQALQRSSLVLVSPFSPESGFSVGNAITRYKYIYCLADVAIAVHSGTDGGTWAGAVENLKKGWVPLWVKRTADARAGNGKLVELGAGWLPEQVPDDDPQTLRDWLDSAGKTLPKTTGQMATGETTKAGDRAQEGLFE